MTGLKTKTRSEGTTFEKAAQIIRDYRDIITKKENENKTFDDIDNEYKENMHSTFGNNSEYGLLGQNSVRHSKSS